jgi:hypothetical protein
LARHLTNFGFKVVGGKHLDFLKTKYAIMPEPTVIVTNPPYSLKDEFIRHCYEIGLPFAFDDCHYEHAVNIGLSIFRKYEKRDWREKFFVYCDAERHTISDVVYRVDWCIKNKVLPYLMRNKNCWESKNKDFYIDLASYCNQYNLVKKITFEQYIKKRQFNNKDRYENSLRLYNDEK